VYLVGSGPGDPGLLTVKAARCLARADVVVYDALANDGLVTEHARPDAMLIPAGKRRGQHALSQAEINAVLVEQARAGKTVVRLKGGDPFVFARGGEEAFALVEAGIVFEVVPGVSSAIAAPAYAGIPVTDRRYSASFAVVTGHLGADTTPPPGNGDGGERPQVDWRRLATATDTLVILMGRGEIDAITRALVENGRPASTPAAAVSWASRPEQRVVVSTVAELAARVDEAKLEAPAVLVIGEVVRLREPLRWFEQKPLFGRRVLVTRAREQASEFGRLLSEAGAEPVELPLIEIAPPADDHAALDAALATLAQQDWVVFTSQNAVEAFFGRMRRRGADARALARAKVAAIGPATARALEAHGLLADVTARDSVAEGLAGELLAAEPAGWAGKRVLIPRALVAREVVPEALREAGATVLVVEAYRTLPAATSSAAPVLARLARGDIDWITFTSSSTVREFMRLFQPGQLPAALGGARVAAIGPITARAAEAAGLKVDLVPATHTVAALCQSIATFHPPAG
jgi:uroporphyrinogen III methyltransferase/synthase